MTGAAADFYEAIISADRLRALSALRRALQEDDAAAVYAGVVQEALYAVGRGWQENRLSVAQEHAATATAQFALSAIFGDLPRTEATRGTALVTSVCGERHQVGVHMIADVLELAGWRTRFLGSDVPPAALRLAVEELQPDVVLLGVTMTESLPALEEAIAAIREVRGDGVRILVGGQACSYVDTEALGIDGCGGDVRDVCALLEQVSS